MNVKVLSIIFLCLLTPAISHGYDFEDCKIVEVIVAGVNNAHVQLNCGIQPRPGCASAGTYFAFDKSTEEGKQYLSVVLTAFASNSNVTGNVDDALCSTYQGNVALLTHLRMRK